MRGAALIVASIAAVLLPSRAPGDDAVLRALVRNAWYWQARGIPEKAESAWQRVLSMDPNDPTALAALGGFHARAGRLAEARQVLGHLERTNPRHVDLPALRRQIELGPRYETLLAEARRLVHDGLVEEGVARYRQLFGDGGPPGDLALEYYQTAGGSRGGWAEARDGLRALARRVPGEPRIRLALGKLLSYRDETRDEAIEILSALARDPAVAKEATAGWRQALLWKGGATPAGAAQIRTYLAAHPDDSDMRRRLEPAARSGAIGSAYAALRRGDLDRAEKLFTAAGDDPDARIGVALIAQRHAAVAQERKEYRRAQALLERARRLAPSRPDLWEQPLREAVFWGLLEDARTAREQHRLGDAETILLDAVQRAPAPERWHAEMALADLYLETGRRRDAEARYTDVLRSVPADPDALRALASLLVAEGRFSDALSVNDRLARAAPGRAFPAAWLRAEDLRGRATRARAAGDLATARASLDQARRTDPSDPWVLHDLANLLLAEGAVAEARPVVEELIHRAPTMVEARVTEARLLAAEREPARALGVLSTLPPGAFDAPLQALRRRLEVEVRIPSLLRLAAERGPAAAVGGMDALERDVRDDADLSAMVALGWARLGDRGRAVALMRRAIAASPATTRTFRLELASSLLQTGDDASVGALIAGLERDPTLSPEERRWVMQLRVTHAERSADASRTEAQRRDARALLGEVLRDDPDDPRLLSALARLLERAGEPSTARRLFRRVLDRVPDDLEAWRGAIDTALAEGDLDEARGLASAAEARFPRNARAHLLAGRVASARRDDGDAMRSLSRGLDLARAAPVAGVAGRSAVGVAEGAPRAAALDADPLASPAAVEAEVRREMDHVRERHRAALDGGGVARSRSGSPGLDALVEYRAWVDAEIPVGYRGRLTFSAAQVDLEAGAPPGWAVPQFGTGTSASGAAPGTQRAYGTELGVRYEDRDVVADIATAPLGFRVFSVLGGLRLRHTFFGALHVEAEGARRSITDSVLSYAGLRDPATGKTWGGVVAEGGRLQLGITAGPVFSYVRGGADRLVGYSVADNRRFQAGAGVDVRLGRGALGDVLIGAAATGFAFDRNLRYFTFGHGGYFSPQRYLRAGLPLTWRRAGAVRWEATVEPGYAWFEEDSAPAIPSAQRGALGSTAGDAASSPPYPGRVTEGWALNARALLGIRLGSGFEASVDATAQRAPEFTELRGILALRYVP